ncbi:MAG: hypothetical protein U1C33_07765, partial [Candidatus Cloacimonadaceae bacterium]|nr:hypothetical protein [Candidatus Cloacimonadaceae bacterium]
MKYYVPLVLLIAILLSACSQPRPVNLNNVDSTKVQIVFAQLKGSESPFKTAVIDAIRIAYQDTAQIHVVSVKNTKDLSGVNADVLIVMDQLKAGLYMNKGLKTFFTAADKDQTLYLITTGDEKWRY